MICSHRGRWGLNPKVWDQGKGFIPYPGRSFGVLRKRATYQICALKGSLAAGGGPVGAGGRVGTRALKGGCWSGPDGHMVRATQLTSDLVFFQWDRTAFLKSDQGHFIVTNVNRKPGV